MSNVKPFVFSIIKLSYSIFDILSQPSGPFCASGVMQYTIDTFSFYPALSAVYLTLGQP